MTALRALEALLSEMLKNGDVYATQASEGYARRALWRDEDEDAVDELRNFRKATKTKERGRLGVQRGAQRQGSQGRGNRRAGFVAAEVVAGPLQQMDAGGRARVPDVHNEGVYCRLRRKSLKSCSEPTLHKDLSKDNLS
jgi:hypothetical protein